ncbi:MAG: polysaccharide deacetylase [Lachnospiraceae bacterium]|nr:polysaccharide deacetylase [Lachnospiraceae bacterium]MBQ8877519.1 polysaccharide deacetylase [Lachnospiraceae bacterium]
MDEAIARRKRINRLKKMILGMVGVAILVPIMICVILAVKLTEQKHQTAQLQLQLAAKEAEVQTEEVTGVFTTAHVEESPREQVEIQETEQEEAEGIAYDKRIYLTFDDGPSSNTDAILDILKQYDVKATFFVVGKTDEQSVALYQRIVEEGHTLGMHSYSHKYDEVYASKESFIQDLTKLQEHLYDVTGVWPRYYRFPGGSSNTVSRVKMQELIAYLYENDITYYDWNVASGDAVPGQLPKDTIVNNCLGGIQAQADSVVLLHDVGEKDTTVAALPEIISKARMQGNVCFLPISDDTLPIQHLTAE